MTYNVLMGTLNPTHSLTQWSWELVWSFAALSFCYQISRSSDLKLNDAGKTTTTTNMTTIITITATVLFCPVLSSTILNTRVSRIIDNLSPNFCVICSSDSALYC